MGANKSARAGRAIGVAGTAIGLLVFLAGVTMIILVFSWGYGMFESIDSQTFAVASASSLAPDQPGSSADIASAQPGGPTLASVGITLAVKFLGLLVLGWLGAMVASKGAEMTAGGARRASEAE